MGLSHLLSARLSPDTREAVDDLIAHPYVDADGVAHDKDTCPNVAGSSSRRQMPFAELAYHPFCDRCSIDWVDHDDEPVMWEAAQLHELRQDHAAITDLVRAARKGNRLPERAQDTLISVIRRVVDTAAFEGLGLLRKELLTARDDVANLLDAHRDVFAPRLSDLLALRARHRHSGGLANAMRGQLEADRATELADAIGELIARVEPWDVPDVLLHLGEFGTRDEKFRADVTCAVHCARRALDEVCSDDRPTLTGSRVLRVGLGVEYGLNRDVAHAAWVAGTGLAFADTCVVGVIPHWMCPVLEQRAPEFQVARDVDADVIGADLLVTLWSEFDDGTRRPWLPHAAEVAQAVCAA